MAFTVSRVGAYQGEDSKKAVKTTHKSDEKGVDTGEDHNEHVIDYGVEKVEKAYQKFLDEYN